MKVIVLTTIFDFNQNKKKYRTRQQIPEMNRIPLKAALLRWTTGQTICWFAAIKPVVRYQRKFE